MMTALSPSTSTCSGRGRCMSSYRYEPNCETSVDPPNWATPCGDSGATTAVCCGSGSDSPSSSGDESEGTARGETASFVGVRPAVDRCSCSSSLPVSGGISCIGIEMIAAASDSGTAAPDSIVSLMTAAGFLRDAIVVAAAVFGGSEAGFSSAFASTAVVGARSSSSPCEQPAATASSSAMTRAGTRDVFESSDLAVSTARCRRLRCSHLSTEIKLQD